LALVSFLVLLSRRYKSTDTKICFEWLLTDLQF
jgi:hypothetical protein